MDDNPPLFLYTNTFRWEVRMNGLESLKKYLEEKFPEANYEISRPARADGFWHLDVLQGQNYVNVIWSEGFGFGVSYKAEPFSGPDEIHPDLEMSLKRVSELLTL